MHELADLARFPFTAKADLRANYPFGMFAVPREQVVRIHASSGTTGKPTVVGYTAEDIDTWAELMARSIRAAGGRPGDVCHVAYGYGLFTGGLGAHYGAERLGCSVVPISGGMTERQVQLILDFEPRIIMVTPSYFLAILDELEAQGVDPRETSLEIGIFGAEPWTDEMRHSVEERSGIRAVDIYGLSEVMGPGVSQEAAETQDGLHVWEDHFLPEIIDPVTGDVLPDGEEGELVFTSLSKQAMPVIRYRTRDLTRLLPGSAYPTFRRMQKVTGRTDDMMIVRGVNVFPSQIEEHLLTIEGLTPHYLCVLTRPGNLDELTVQVERAERRPGPRGPGRRAGGPRQAARRVSPSASRWSSRARSSARWARRSGSATVADGRAHRVVGPDHVARRRTPPSPPAAAAYRRAVQRLAALRPLGEVEVAPLRRPRTHGVLHRRDGALDRLDRLAGSG